MNDYAQLDKLAETAATADFGDERLSARFAKVVKSVGLTPSASFPKAMKSGDLEAFYRFINNSRVDFASASEPFMELTADLCAQMRTVIVAHDSSEFTFTGEREGLGRMRTANRGFLGHFALAVGQAGKTSVPLGLLAARHLVRPKKRQRRYTGNQARLNAGQEWRRWGENVDEVEARLEERASALHVMDSEADAYWLFSHLRGRRFVIRLCHDRKLDTESEADPASVRQALEGGKIELTRDVKLSRRRPTRPTKKRHQARAQRTAKLSVRAMALRLKKPPYADHKTHASASLPDSLSVNVVQVTEIDPPEGEVPVEWLLVTTEPIDTAEQIAAIIDAYRVRWLIEEFFKALKTGCAYEARQSESLDALLNILAICLPIACRLLSLRALERQAPNLPASDVLNNEELSVLKVIAVRQLPERPTLAEAMGAIALLGGHLKSNGPPGWQVLWRGFKDLQDAVRIHSLLSKADLKKRTRAKRKM